MPGIEMAQQIFVEWVISIFCYNMFPYYLNHLWGSMTELNEEKEKVYEANFWFHIFYILLSHFEMDLNDAYIEVIYDIVFCFITIV